MDRGARSHDPTGGRRTFGGIMVCSGDAPFHARGNGADQAPLGTEPPMMLSAEDAPYWHMRVAVTVACLVMACMACPGRDLGRSETDDRKTAPARSGDHEVHHEPLRGSSLAQDRQRRCHAAFRSGGMGCQPAGGKALMTWSSPVRRISIRFSTHFARSSYERYTGIEFPD